MTVAAVVAALPKIDSDGFVGCIADSRLYYDRKHVEDGVDKLFPLGNRACAVGAGLQAPFLAAHVAAVQDIEGENNRRAERGDRNVAIWEVARIFFDHLRREGKNSGTQETLQALIAGFLRDSSPAIAGATIYPSGGYILTLFKPKRGEVVVQTIGAAASRSLVAEALAMDFASGDWRIDHVVSLLRDLSGDSAHEASDFRNVGGAPTVCRCAGNGTFEFPTCEIDGQQFHRGQWVPRTGNVDVNGIAYVPVFQDLDARNEIKRHFVGGQPRASYIYTPSPQPEHSASEIGVLGLFRSDEPRWASDESKRVPMSMPGVPLLWSRPTTGLHPNDDERFKRYQQATRRPRRSKKR